VGQLATADTCLQNILIIKQVVLSLFRRLSARRYMRLLLSAGACSTAPAAIDLRGALSSKTPAAVVAVDRRDSQTDGQTPGR